MALVQRHFRLRPWHSILPPKETTTAENERPNLSTLTLGILKKRYQVHVQCEKLSSEAMKKVVQEELMKMKDHDKNGSELETKKVQNKRKREKENDEMIIKGEDESSAKKSRCQSSSSTESEDKEDCKTGSEESEEDQVESGSENEEVEKSHRKRNGNSKHQIRNSEDSTDEETDGSEREGKESNCGDSPKEKVKKKETGGQGKKRPQSDEENDTDTDNESKTSDKINANDSSDDNEKEEKVSVKRESNDQDSESSSLSSLEDEQDNGTENAQDNEKKKNMKKRNNTKSRKVDNKTVARLKHYIALCGVRRNYKKLLNGCHSVGSCVAALQKELDDLGVHGRPSVKKCKKVRMKREQAEELAALDVSNIIATQGRPKRRGAWTCQEKQDPSSSRYLRTLNSGSDSDEENNAPRGHRRDWANLQGIISDDADSN